MANKQTKEKKGLPALRGPVLTPAEIAAFEGQMAQDAKDDSARVAPTGQWISIRGRSASIGKVPIEMPLQVIVLAFVTERAFYPNPFDEGNITPPLCWGLGTGKPTDVVPDPSVIDKQAATCAECKYNQWSSRLDGKGRGKACSEHRRAALLTFNDDEADIRGIKVPPKSLINFDNYVMEAQRAGLPIYAFETEINWDPKFPGFPAITFKTVEQVPKSSYGLIASVLPQARQLIQQPFQTKVEDNKPARTAAAPEGKGVPRKRKF